VKAGSAFTVDQTFPCACAGKESEIEAAEGDSGNDRQLAPVEVVLQGRGLALRRPGMHSGRPLAQSGLVDEDGQRLAEWIGRRMRRAG